MTVREQLRSVSLLRHGYLFCRALQDRVRWREPVVAKWLEQTYRQADPWNYVNCPDEQDRFSSALALLNRGGDRFQHGFEIGCAEGVFTERLAKLCVSLHAVDISAVAITRARQRCAYCEHVKCYEWDLRRDPLPPHIDLIVVMDVLELFYRPGDIRKAREKLVAALRPGGYLLLGNSRQCPSCEGAWWTRWLLRGGKQIADFFRLHSDLTTIRSDTGRIYCNALFQKRQG
jgi:SAM-dependent methyltransferase